MTQKTMVIFCKGCNDLFAIPSRRGRPPDFCSSCKNDDKVQARVETERKEAEAEVRTISANERVDRLELMLRANNSHISQHRERYPWAT